MNTDTANPDEIDLRDRHAVAAVLRTVPRRFVVGFAARCARRVQPELLGLSDLPLDDGYVRFHFAECQISVAEAYALGRIQRTRTLDDLPFGRRLGLWYPAATAALFAANATREAADAITCAADSAAEAAGSVTRGLPAAIHDFNAVRALSRNNPDDFLDDRPVPDGFFGPLWVDGMPEEYRAVLAKLNPEKVPAPEVGPEELGAELSAEGKSALDDRRWVSRQLNLGTFDEFGGEYIAVVGKKLLGHDRNLLKLREDVTRETGISVNRIVTRLVHRPRRTPAPSAPTPDTTS